MKRAFVAAALAGLGCGEEEGTRAGVLKGLVDRQALSAGVSVKVCAATNVAMFEVPMAREIPAVADDKLAAQAGPALTLTVKSEQSGTTTSLTTVRAVARVPQEADEASCEVLAGRKKVRVRLFNRLSTGLKLAPGRSYTGTVAIARNDWIEDLPSLATAVTVASGCE